MKKKSFNSILKHYPDHYKVNDRQFWEGTPCLYLIKFSPTAFYVGETKNLSGRLEKIWKVSPLLRFLKVNPRKYPVYFLEKVRGRKNRKKAEEDLIKWLKKEYPGCLVNVLHNKEGKE